MKTEPLVFESNSTEETEKWAGELASKLPSKIKSNKVSKNKSIIIYHYFKITFLQSIKPLIIPIISPPT